MMAVHSHLRTLRIVHLIPTLKGGGAERQVRYIAAASAALGHSVAIASKMTAQDEEELTALGVTPFILSGRSSFDPMLIAQTVSIVKHTKADIIQTWLPQCDVLGAAGSLITGIPMILSERSSAKAYPPGWRRNLRHLAGRHAKMIIANSPSGRDFWDGHSNRRIIPNALAPRDMDTALSPHVPQRRPGAQIVLYGGRLAHEKNVQQIISAIPYLQMPNVQFLIAGDGPEHDALKKMSAAIARSDDVVFLGYQPDLYPWLKEAALFVSASTFEGHPNAVLEAAQAGTPLLLSEIPMHRDAIGDGASYFMLHDARALAMQIDAILSDQQTAAGRAAIATTYLENLTVDKITEMYVEAYRSLCDLAR